MSEIIKVRNDTDSDIYLTELGQQLVEASGGIAELSATELQNGIPKVELESFISDLDIVVLDSSNADLSIVDGINLIRNTVATEVRIQEELIKTGGHFQAKSVQIDVDATVGWKEASISFPFPISLLSAEYTGHPDYQNDEGMFLVGEDTITGTVTSDVTASDTIINVSQTVVNSASVGYVFRLDDGTNLDDLGRCIAVDAVAKTITMETAAVNSFAAATPTYVKQTVELGPCICFSDSGVIAVGSSKIGGSYVPPNTVIKLKYNNISGTAKKFNVLLEYLY